MFKLCPDVVEKVYNILLFGIFFWKIVDQINQLLKMSVKNINYYVIKVCFFSLKIFL